MGTATTARDLAVGFEKRRSGRVDARGVRDNLVELAVAGVRADRAALRAVAAGCGATAFSLGASENRVAAVINDAAVRLGLAERAYELAVEKAKADGFEVTGLPGTQFAASRMRSSIATMAALLDRQADRATAADDLAEAAIAALFIAPEAETVVSTAFGLVGGDAEATARLGQIWHDLKAATAPVPADLARELVGKAAVGIDPAETPRWL